MLLFV
jgi:hypothetical protein